MVAQDVLERLVEEVRRGVVRHGREPDAPGHDRTHAVAFAEPLAFEQQRLVVLQAVRLAERPASAAAVVGLDPAGISHLSPARRVERRLAKLGEEEPVPELFDGADLRENVGFLVPDELRSEAGGLRELGRTLVVLRDRGTRALALLLHEPRELLLVHAQAALARELLRELEREAVRVVETEGVLTRDVATLLGHLLEQPDAARQRLAEAPFLGRQD